MCMFGLRHPVTKLSLRKASQVYTTSQNMYQQLVKSKCKHDHEHQTIEGSVSNGNVRMPLTQFCASYCRGFTRQIAKWMIQTNSQLACIGEHEDEPPAKRFKFSFNPNKRFKKQLPIDLDPEENQEDSEVINPPEPNLPNPEADATSQREAATSDTSSKEAGSPWLPIFRECDKRAPRVGNLRIDASCPVVAQIQALLTDIQVTAVYICRGAERCQIPMGIPEPQHNVLRHTICWHRTTGQVHEFSTEEWTKLKRSQRIRAAVPSKIMISCFGSKPVSSALPEAPVPSLDSREPSKIPQSSEDPAPKTESRMVPSVPTFCVKAGLRHQLLYMDHVFRNLSSQEKQDLRKLHINLGHPAPNVLAEHLKAQNAAPHVVEAAKDFVCDACVESTGQKAPRPAKLHEPRDFNDLIGMDGFFWTGIRGFQVHVFHCIDEASLFHLGKRCHTRNPDEVIESWSEYWTSWAGNPNKIYSDPAGEFISDQWKDMLMSRSIQPLITVEAWQRGRVERHGQIIKRMLSRFDLERPIENLDQFDQALRACFQAKNSLVRHQGYSPEQIVLGKAAKLPASLTSDEDAPAHALADSEEPECEVFRRALETRTLARKTFLITDNDQAMRRALLRKSRPSSSAYSPGQLVMFWVKKANPGRCEVGRWSGPAKIVFQESPTSVWISYAERLFKRSPESLRPASMREWQMHQDGGPKWYENLPECKEPPRSIPNIDDLVYEPSIAPESPNAEPPNIPPSPNSEVQPESESFPEPPISIHSDNEPNPPPEIPSDSAENIAENEAPNVEADTSSGDDALVILNCNLISSGDEPSELFEWTTAQGGDNTENVLLAEDGMHYHDNPLQCQEQECFHMEIMMTEHDVRQWSESHKPEELAAVASASKRARAEVSVKTLTLDEKILFEKAKDAELNCWIQTNALKPILRKHLNPEQILKSRWILTWKAVDEETNHGTKQKAKARLVVLGFQDPKLTEVARDSPTLTREGRHTVLQTIASMQWELCSFDIKTAFLRGHADSSNPLAMEPPPELRKKLNLSDQHVCSLIGNAYGRVDAPLLFYKEFTRQLTKLGFKIHPLESCLFILETFEQGVRTVHGVLGAHVDDGVCGGDSYFHEQISKLREVLPFGSFKKQRFVFTGILLDQLPDGSIVASQEDYVNKIPAIDIGRPRRLNPESPVTESELSKLRGLIGSLQYAVTHTRPDMASKLGDIQVQVSKATVQTLISANKVLREAQENSQVRICFRHIPVSQLTHVSFGDASFASAKQLSSFQGTIICATNQNLEQNKKAPISSLTWTSKKIARVVRSTLSAEAFSMSGSVDKLGWMRLLWGVINVDNFNWREPLKGFQQLPLATIVTDCKSLYDLVSRTAIPSCEEFRTTLEVLLIRERCQEHCSFRWIPTSLQLADALTKCMDATLLRQVLASSSFQLHDEADSLQRNAHKKQAIQWLKDQQIPSKMSVTSTEF